MLRHPNLFPGGLQVQPGLFSMRAASTARARGDAMCPFCMAAIGQIVVAGVVSTGGLTALAVKLSRKKNDEKEIVRNSNERKEK